MTDLALLLLLLAALAPLLDPPLRRIVADPVLPVAVVAAALLATAAATAAVADGIDGWQRAAAAVLGVLVAVTAGSHLVRAVFRLTRREFRMVRVGATARPPAAGDTGSPAAGDTGPLELEAAGSVLRGGAWIGYLERGAVSATLLAAFPEGLALVLAVKGVGRYPELRDSGRAGGPASDAPEEFIIGTLASVLWAAAAAGTATLLR
jgi:hypothetical protein